MLISRLPVKLEKQGGADSHSGRLAKVQSQAANVAEGVGAEEIQSELKFLLRVTGERMLLNALYHVAAPNSFVKSLSGPSPSHLVAARL